MILLENLRFHVEEEGKGVDSEGKKVYQCTTIEKDNDWKLCYLCIYIIDIKTDVIVHCDGKSW